jgi:hypothetical protein
MTRLLSLLLVALAFMTTGASAEDRLYGIRPGMSIIEATAALTGHCSRGPFEGPNQSLICCIGGTLARPEEKPSGTIYDCDDAKAALLLQPSPKGRVQMISLAEQSDLPNGKYSTDLAKELGFEGPGEEFGTSAYWFWAGRGWIGMNGDNLRVMPTELPEGSEHRWGMWILMGNERIDAEDHS